MRTNNFSTLIDLLRLRAAQQPDQVAYTFLEDGETDSTELTYQRLDQRAQAIAAQLQATVSAGDRILLLYQAGLDYITAFFGCLYAGVVAVPAYPPRNNHSLSRLQTIITDAQATASLTTTSVLANISRQINQSPDLQQMQWFASDETADHLAASWCEPNVQTDTLAFLQYTSGSTGTPKGVMVSHANLLHNQALIQQAMGHSQDTIFVGWLPLFHDMGLIGNMLQPLYLGIPCILMSPVSFLQKPIRWLQAISTYRATTSGAPNFAYDLCVRKVSEEQRATLDLSSWEVAFNGAEPVRAQTLERFATAFEPCGFRREALYPCYGMAETTLIVSGGSKQHLPIFHTVQASALQQNQLRLVEDAADSQVETQVIVGCGKAILDLQVVIANPQTLTRCQPDEIGEIWVKGASVAQGYWQNAEATQQSFQAYLQDTEEGPFLRTGDLGCLHAGELFVTGRLKDLIIIGGRNHYPQDLELTAFQSHPALRPDCGAAFSVDVNDTEKLVIVQEVERSHIRKLNLEEVVGAIRLAIAEHHDLNVYAVVLIKTGSLPKTSSGKVQRRTCRAQFLADELAIVGQWSAPTLNELALSAATADALGANRLPADPFSEMGIESWLTARLAQRLGLSSLDIDRHQPFSYYGLGSMDAVDLVGDLEAWLNRPLSPTLPWEYPSIQSLTQYLISLDQDGAESSQPERSQPPSSRDQSIDQLLSYIEHLSADETIKALEQSNS
ncbi:MAG: AMP-binding protein [Almyronema sp.]